MHFLLFGDLIEFDYRNISIVFPRCHPRILLSFFFGKFRCSGIFTEIISLVCQRERENDFAILFRVELSYLIALK